MEAGRRWIKASQFFEYSVCYQILWSFRLASLFLFISPPTFLMRQSVTSYKRSHCREPTKPIWSRSYRNPQNSRHTNTHTHGRPVRPTAQRPLHAGPRWTCGGHIPAEQCGNFPQEISWMPKTLNNNKDGGELLVHGGRRLPLPWTNQRPSCHEEKELSKERYATAGARYVRNGPQHSE